ncbi:sugar ABC transporter permease, partial [Streptococcus agalactiae]|nr:sugar ABC transporter permease [Streptococcus agalactiae]
FVYQVIPAVKGLISLGTQEQGMTTKTVDGIKIQVATQGDNSMLMLIFGLASLIFCCVFAYIYWSNIKSAAHLLTLKEEGREIPSFKKDIKSLTDGRFHMT